MNISGNGSKWNYVLNLLQLFMTFSKNNTMIVTEWSTTMIYLTLNVAWTLNWQLTLENTLKQSGANTL